MKIEVVYSFKKIYNDWNRLYNMIPDPSPFFHPKTFKITLRNFYPYYILHHCIPFFVIFKENQTIRAIIPLLKFINWRKESRIQLFGFPNGFNESDILYDSVEIIPKCLDLLRERLGKIEFIKIDQRSPLCKFIPVENHIQKNVAIILSKDFDSYLSLLSKSVRQNIRTAFNRLKIDGRSIELRIFPGGQSKIPTSEIISLYCERHSKKYSVKSSYIKKWYLKKCHFATKFYKKSENALTAVLFIDNKFAAFLNGVTNDFRIIIPRLSINEDYLRYSPGLLLIHEVIKYLIESTSIRVFDLGVGEEKYKYDLGGVVHNSYNFFIS